MCTSRIVKGCQHATRESKVKHYENTSIQIYRKFHLQNWKCSDKKTHISAQNIDCGYTLEPPRVLRVPTINVLSRYKKNMYTPVNPSFTI